MANWLAAAGIALSVGSAAIAGAYAGWALVAALALACAGAFLGARGILVLFGLLLSVSLYFLEPAGAQALLKSLGVNPGAFFRVWSAPLKVGFAALIAALLTFALIRRGPTGHHAAIETADDIEMIATGIGKIAALLFIPMMLLIFYDITQRKMLDFSGDFIDSPLYLSSTKLQEMEWHLHGALFLLCLGFAYVKDAHVRIELVRDVMGPRTRVWMEMIGAALFLFAYCAVIIRFGFTFAERSWASGEVSSAQTGLEHRWVIKALLPVGFIILGATGVAAVLRCWVYLYGPPDLRAESERYAGTHHADLPADVATRGPITD